MGSASRRCGGRRAAAVPVPARHLTIIDTLAIGIPSFFLALAPNTRRYRPGFASRVLRFAIPASGIVAAATFSAAARWRDPRVMAGINVGQSRSASPGRAACSARALIPSSIHRPMMNAPGSDSAIHDPRMRGLP
jgi:hypothetical protein